MELIKLGEKTYYIKNNTNIGVYKISDTEVFIIDSGNDKDAGKKILKIINDQGWNIKGIINTHAHADHVGGNKVIQDRCNSKIYSLGVEASIIRYPILESTILYGASPLNKLKNKFLMAKESIPNGDINDLPKGLEYFNIKGHYIDMIGIKTDDDVYFLGDALFSKDTINKYHVFYIYDVLEYLNTLDYLDTLDGKYFIASHVDCLDNIKDIININRNKVLEIINYILDICKNDIIFEDILKKIFDIYNLNLNIEQYYLVGSTIKAYLSYLYNLNKIDYSFKNNKMYWKRT